MAVSPTCLSPAWPPPLECPPPTCCPQFDQAAFHFSFLPFSIPYPVPFRLLGDERKVRASLA